MRGRRRLPLREQLLALGGGMLDELHSLRGSSPTWATMLARKTCWLAPSSVIPRSSCSSPRRRSQLDAAPHHVGRVSTCECSSCSGDRVRAIADLKVRRSRSLSRLGASQHVFLASMVAHVGLDPRKDVKFVSSRRRVQAAARGAEGRRLPRISAGPSGAPRPEGRTRRRQQHGRTGRGRSTFAASPRAHREFVRKHPIATKRALRAILKAADICALEPDRAARASSMAASHRATNYALQTMKDVPYNTWRIYDPEDSVRFYALRLREAGNDSSRRRSASIAEGTDWRFLNEPEEGAEGLGGRMHTRRHLLVRSGGAVGSGHARTSPATRRSGATARDDDAGISHSPSLCAAPQFVARGSAAGARILEHHVRQIGRSRSLRSKRDLASGEIHFGTDSVGRSSSAWTRRIAIVCWRGSTSAASSWFGNRRGNTARSGTSRVRPSRVWALPERRPRLRLGDGGPRRARSPKDIAGPSIPRRRANASWREGKVDAYMAFPLTLRSCARTDRPRRRE